MECFSKWLKDEGVVETLVLPAHAEFGELGSYHA